VARARRDTRPHIVYKDHDGAERTGYRVRELARGKRKGWIVISVLVEAKEFREVTVDPARTRECKCNLCWRRIEAEVR
jgi:hypothetical protein